MSGTSGSAVPPRIRTGVPGLDEILGGGLFRGGVYMVVGAPGVGKTVLGNQVAFNHARNGGRVVYATLLSESHGRLLAFMREMTFFEARFVGDAITYLNGYTSVETEGLHGLLKLLRGLVRERSASLLVIDGMLSAAALGQTEVEYKKFVQQLQTWIEVVGCTVVLLSSAREIDLRPEYTMVDGIFELEYARVGPRRIRELTVKKLRGSAYREGSHAYEIHDAGVVVWPRIETFAGQAARAKPPPGDRARFGVERLDALFEGGLARGSATLILGANGVGKTTLGLHFLAGGLEAGERGVHFSFYEDPPAVMENADRLGLGFSRRVERGDLRICWQPSSEISLDRVGHEMLAVVRRIDAKRLFFDGLEAFMRAAYPERMPAFFSALVQEFRTLGVTTMFTSEVFRLLVTDFRTPFPGLSALVDNIVLLLQNEVEGRLVRAVAVAKARARPHGRGVLEFTIGPRGIEFPAGGPLVATGTAAARTRRKASSRRGSGGRKR